MRGAIVLICAMLQGCGGGSAGGGAVGGPVIGGNAGIPTWDWQLSAVNLNVDVDVIDLDPDAVSSAQIAALKARGIDTIAYISVGTLENWRSDAGAFPGSVIGKIYGDWPDERFLDIRDRETLLPLMEARFRAAADKGFVAIEPDNMDVYTNDSGFAVSKRDTVLYVLDLAEIAHGMDLQIGQKNVPELVPDFVDFLDFMIAEDCFADGWCGQTLPYIEAGKPVFAAEYDDTGVDFGAACTYANSVGISMVLKDRDLTGPALASC